VTFDMGTGSFSANGLPEVVGAIAVGRLVGLLRVVTGSGEETIEQARRETAPHTLASVGRPTSTSRRGCSAAHTIARAATSG
jgi:hypothetical protein